MQLWITATGGTFALNLGGNSQQQAAPANSQLLWNNATGGTFEATFLTGGLLGTSKTTKAISYDATAAQVAAAINAVIPLGPSVSVTGSGTATDPWVITGLTSPLATNDSGLAGGVLGSSGQSIYAQLTSGGILNATAGNQGIYLNLGSGESSDRSRPATRTAVTATW